MAAPLPAHGRVRAPDGTPIAWFREPAGPAPAEVSAAGPAAAAPTPAGGRPALLLVHGTTADHTTFRVFGPRMAMSRTTISLDRRGRGASGDGPDHAFAREVEDVAAVADALAASTGEPVDVFGHSFGGRCALGAAALAPASIRRVVSYEGAVREGDPIGDDRLVDRLERLHREARWAELLETFLRDGVGMSDEEWRTFREAPVWGLRLAAAPTIVRELRAGREPEGSLDRLAELRQPVLQVVGSESSAVFGDGARSLAGRLPEGRLEVIVGARHAAHHTHVDELVRLVSGFLDG